MYKKNKIKFTYYNELVYEIISSQEKTKPRPATNFTPEWYKKMVPYEISDLNPTGRKLLVQEGNSNATAKKCIPMLDSIHSGYIIPLWCDVQIIQIKDIESNIFYPQINWRVSLNVFEMHGPTSKEIPPPFGYSDVVFKFLAYFNIKTPKGYSIIINSPFNNNNLPFYAIPAIIDSDKSVIGNNFPCWVQEGFEGIVEKGTPIIQITPFKRTEWERNFSKISYEKQQIKEMAYSKSNILNNYQKNMWAKKKYL